MENMRKTKLLPRKRKLIPKSIIKTARLVRESLEEQDEYLKKRSMKEIKPSGLAGNQEVEVKQQVWFKDSGPFRTIYDQRTIEYKTADGKWHKL